MCSKKRQTKMSADWSDSTGDAGANLGKIPGWSSSSYDDVKVPLKTRPGNAFSYSDEDGETPGAGQKQASQSKPEGNGKERENDGREVIKSQKPERKNIFEYSDEEIPVVEQKKDDSFGKPRQKNRFEYSDEDAEESDIEQERKVIGKRNLREEMGVSSSDNFDPIEQARKIAPKDDLGSQSRLKSPERKRVVTYSSDEEPPPAKSSQNKRAITYSSDEEISPPKSSQNKRVVTYSSDDEQPPAKSQDKNRKMYSSDEEVPPSKSSQKKRIVTYSSDDEQPPAKSQEKKRAITYSSDEDEKPPAKSVERKRVITYSSDDEVPPSKSSGKKPVVTYYYDDEDILKPIRARRSSHASTGDKTAKDPVPLDFDTRDSKDESIESGSVQSDKASSKSGKRRRQQTSPIRSPDKSSVKSAKERDSSSTSERSTPTAQQTRTRARQDHTSSSQQDLDPSTDDSYEEFKEKSGKSSPIRATPRVQQNTPSPDPKQEKKRKHRHVEQAPDSRRVQVLRMDVYTVPSEKKKDTNVEIQPSQASPTKRSMRSGTSRMTIKSVSDRLSEKMERFEMNIEEVEMEADQKARREYADLVRDKAKNILNNRKLITKKQTRQFQVDADVNSVKDLTRSELIELNRQLEEEIQAVTEQLEKINEDISRLSRQKRQLLREKDAH